MTTKTHARQRQGNGGGRWVASLIAAGFLAFGVFAAGWWGPMWLRAARHSRGFLPVPGVLEAVDLRSHSKPKGGRRYELVVNYRYEVAGQSYLGERWGAAGQQSSSSRKKLQDWAGLHPVGSAVEVFYDPADPSQAVLERGGEGRAWMIIGLGAAFGGLGLVVLVVRLRRPAASTGAAAPGASAPTA